MFAQLIDLNPWMQRFAAPLAALTPSAVEDLLSPGAVSAPLTPELADIARARLEFHRSQAAKGRDVWNRWAMAMDRMRVEPTGKPVRQGCAIAAHVDFSGVMFEGDLDLQGFAFPGRLSLEKTGIGGDFYASGIVVADVASLAALHVAGDCWMERATFAQVMRGIGARFDRRVEARSIIFRGPADFRASRFGRDAWFSGSEFQGVAQFGDAEFLSDAGFSGCRFATTASFEAVRFGDTVGMEKCRFEGRFDLSGCDFAKGLFFQDAVFAQEPLIAGAHFVRAPNLAGARFPDEDAAGAQGMPTLRQVAAG